MKSELKNSFLIATNRKYDKHAKIVVDQLEAYGALDSGEIVVCCPSEIDDSRIKYIKDNKQQNGNVAFNEAARNSIGENIYILCDDHFVSSNIIYGDEYLESLTFKNRKYKISSMSSGAPCYIGGIPNFPQTEFIPKSVMCRFPFFTRQMYIEHMNEHVFHPNFNICSHFADNYLSYFLALNEEPTIECNYIKLQEMPNICDSSESME